MESQIEGQSQVRDGQADGNPRNHDGFGAGTDIRTQSPDARPDVPVEDPYERAALCREIESENHALHQAMGLGNPDIGRYDTATLRSLSSDAAERRGWPKAVADDFLAQVSLASAASRPRRLL